VDIDLVFVTYNRLYYTRLALESVLADPEERFRLTIWDNHSTDGTIEYLKHEVRDPRIVDVVFSRENLGPTAAINEVWGKSKAELVGKLDNDCRVTPGWTRTFAQAHQDIPELGAVACWHFRLEDFDEQKASHKIQTLGNHKIFRHPYVCGSGFLMKHGIFKQIGPCTVGPNVGLTHYFLQVARRGYVNGWYYPLILQDHMDDPLSEHTLLNSDEDVVRAGQVTFNLRNRNIRTIDERLRWRQTVLRDLLESPWDVKHYVGWRAKLKRGLEKLNRRLSVGRRDNARAG